VKLLTSLDVLRDLILGERHSRRTLIGAGMSAPTADRRLRALVDFPGVVRSKEGKLTWFAWDVAEAEHAAYLEHALRAARKKAKR
jgi:hypothetical protein